MANFLSKLFGTKSDRDLKEVKPFLDATLKAYPEIQKLDNDLTMLGNKLNASFSKIKTA